MTNYINNSKCSKWLHIPHMFSTYNYKSKGEKFVPLFDGFGTIGPFVLSMDQIHAKFEVIWNTWKY